MRSSCCTGTVTCLRNCWTEDWLRLPLMKTLKLHDVPPALAAVWASSLYSLRQLSLLNHCCFPTSCSTTTVEALTQTALTLACAECTENAVKNAPPEAAPDVLLLLAALCLHQPHLSPFPDKALKVRHPRWVEPPGVTVCVWCGACHSPCSRSGPKL